MSLETVIVTRLDTFFQIVALILKIDMFISNVVNLGLGHSFWVERIIIRGTLKGSVFGTVCHMVCMILGG